MLSAVFQAGLHPKPVRHNMQISMFSAEGGVADFLSQNLIWTREL